MAVLGSTCLVFDDVHGSKCDIEPLYPSIGTANKVPIVDTEVAYTCLYTHATYVLIARNELYVPSMDNNLIPFFILW